MDEDFRKRIFLSQSIMNAVWMVFLSGVLAVSASPSCDKEEVLKCGAGTDPSKEFPADAAELEKQCSESAPKLACVSDYLKRCPTMADGSEAFFIATVKFNNRLCYGDLHDLYLRNAKCFSDVFYEKVMSCAKKDYSKFKNDVCKVKAEVENCVKSSVKDACGNEAYEFLLEVYEVAKLVDDGTNCPSSSNTVFSSVSTMIFAYSIYLVISYVKAV